MERAGNEELREGRGDAKTRQYSVEPGGRRISSLRKERSRRIAADERISGQALSKMGNETDVCGGLRYAPRRGQKGEAAIVRVGKSLS